MQLKNGDHMWRNKLMNENEERRGNFIVDYISLY